MPSVRPVTSVKSIDHGKLANVKLYQQYLQQPASAAGLGAGQKTETDRNRDFSPKPNQNRPTSASVKL